MVPGRIQWIRRRKAPLTSPEQLTHYTFSARVVFKPFVNREDAWEEYQNWVDDYPLDRESPKDPFLFIFFLYVLSVLAPFQVCSVVLQAKYVDAVGGNGREILEMV